MNQDNIKLAGCVVLDSQGCILLLHRKTAKRRQWEIPGGKIEPGESPEQTAIREAKEELDIYIGIIKLLGYKEFQEDNQVMHYTWFLAEISSGKPKIMEPQTFDELKYFSSADLKKAWSSLSSNTQNFLNSNQDNIKNLHSIKGSIK